MIGSIFQFLDEINKAEPKFSLKAFRLLCFYMPNQGTDYITHNEYISYITGMNIDTIRKAKKELRERGVIDVKAAYTGKVNNRISGTYVTVNYEWKSKRNDHGKNKVILNDHGKNEPNLNEPNLNEPILNEPNLNELNFSGVLINKRSKEEKEETKEKLELEKNLKKEKLEGGAAEPPPTPAPGKIPSQGSNTEATPQRYNIPCYPAQYSDNEQKPPTGEINLFGEASPPGEQEKPKGKRKTKPAGQIQIPTVADVEQYITKYIQDNYSIHHYEWTQWELSETAKDILEAFPKYKWKDWRQGARNWIRNNRGGAFLPKMKDPGRVVKNPPGQAGKQFFTAEQIEQLTGRTDPQTVLEQRRKTEDQKGNVIAQN